MKDFFNGLLRIMKLTTERLLILALGLMCVYLALSNQKAGENWKDVVDAYKEQNKTLIEIDRDKDKKIDRLSQEKEDCEDDKFALRDSTAVMYERIAKALKLSER